MLAGHLALAAAAAFAGAAFYINFAEHPARLTLDDGNLLRQWKLAYAAGYTMQSSLAVVSGVCGLLAGWQTGDWRWAAGAVLMLANWPFTLIAIMPTNHALDATEESSAGPQTRAMLHTWNRLHAVRTALGISATTVYLWTLN